MHFLETVRVGCKIACQLQEDSLTIRVLASGDPDPLAFVVIHGGQDSLGQALYMVGYGASPALDELCLGIIGSPTPWSAFQGADMLRTAEQSSSATLCISVSQSIAPGPSSDVKSSFASFSVTHRH